ncbi:MAG: hypothetical protein IJU21_00285 [Bacteroidales bacterium]|nr:hypothetical protein [Bacteroidales bacterium]
MRVYKYIVSLLVITLAAGCVKAPEPQGADMHEFTQEELQKKKLDQAFTLFFQEFSFENPDNPTAEILRNSRISLAPGGGIRYTYLGKNVTLITADIGKDGFSADLHGGIHLEGTGFGNNPITVFIDGENVAVIDFITYNDTPMPVFRFPDGTTYAITGVLLVEPLIDFLLKNVLSTE